MVMIKRMSHNSYQLEPYVGHICATSISSHILQMQLPDVIELHVLGEAVKSLSIQMKVLTPTISWRLGIHQCMRKMKKSTLLEASMPSRPNLWRDKS